MVSFIFIPNLWLTCECTWQEVMDFTVIVDVFFLFWGVQGWKPPDGPLRRSSGSQWCSKKEIRYFASWCISSYFVPVKVVFCSSVLVRRLVNVTHFKNASVFKYASTLLFFIFPLMRENKLFLGANSTMFVQENWISLQRHRDNLQPCFWREDRTQLGDSWQPSLGQQRFIFLATRQDIVEIFVQSFVVFSCWAAAGEFK